jgi:hypothetical protein
MSTHHCARRARTKDSFSVGSKLLHDRHRKRQILCKSMKVNRLGSSDLLVSEACLGAAPHTSVRTLQPCLLHILPQKSPHISYFTSCVFLLCISDLRALLLEFAAAAIHVLMFGLVQSSLFSFNETMSVTDVISQEFHFLATESLNASYLKVLIWSVVGNSDAYENGAGKR